MQKAILLVGFAMIYIGNLFAQDTIHLNGQPNWKPEKGQWPSGMDIADHCFFYEDAADNPLTFDEIKKQSFIPYTKELRVQKLSNRPLIIQWYRFIIHNTSATDSIQLKLFLGAHYFNRLYAGDQLVSIGGAYETNKNMYSKQGSLVKVPPLATVTFFARTEDRMSLLVPPKVILETSFIAITRDAMGKFRDRFLFLLMALIAGCLFFISVYAVYQYYLYRDKAFPWYIAYTVIAFMIALFWMDIRLGLKMFSALFHDLILSVFTYIVPVLYTFFIGNMLQLPIHFKKGWMIVKLFVFILVLQMLIEFITFRTGWFMLNHNYFGYFISIIPMVLLHIILTVLTLMSKDKVKWFLFAGLVSLLLLWCLPLTGVFALIPAKRPELFMILIFPPVFLLLGLAVEAICFSFALSYRSKLVLVEKNKLQQYHAKDLEEKLNTRTIELEEQITAREEQKLQQIETAFEQKIAETEMTALRAQMNPHFIFNCLNSIKLYTLENDSQTASEYLTIFSQLIRLVLENSRSEKVTLQKELETLRLYIQLEAMRFKDKVKYQVNVAPEIDQQYIDIPPLLLQPYVENAIWHGLMHKKEGGNIVIDVTLPTEHCLQIEITDDGIGRVLAAAYKSKSATRQKSFGLKMTSERIDIINQVYNIKADVQITDLKDGMNNAAGTKVIIKIPV